MGRQAHAGLPLVTARNVAALRLNAEGAARTFKSGQKPAAPPRSVLREFFGSRDQSERG